MSPPTPPRTPPRTPARTAPHRGRRPLILATAAALLLPAAGAARAQAPAADPRLGERAAGPEDAPVTVQEFFSLTCGHCAAFHRTTWPRVKQELVDTGKLRMIWRDFPLDRVGLAAAMVSRALPAERYAGFISALFASQERWAFATNPLEELAKLAALAGMPRAQFDQVVRDEGLARAVLERRAAAEREHQIQSTPSFVFRGPGGEAKHAGNLTYERFAELVEGARRGG